MATQQKTTIVIEGDSTKATEALDKVNQAVDKVKENVKELGKEFDKLEPAVTSIKNAAKDTKWSNVLRKAKGRVFNLEKIRPIKKKPELIKLSTAAFIFKSTSYYYLLPLLSSKYPNPRTVFNIASPCGSSPNFERKLEIWTSIDRS